MPKTAADRVIEWANVKAVMTLATPQKAPAKPSTGSHLLPVRITGGKNLRDTILAYIRQGTHDIWSGYDHILFVCSLLLPAVLLNSRTLASGVIAPE